MGLLLVLGCTKSGRGAAKISQIALEGPTRVKVGLEFVKPPPGDASQASLGVGSIALVRKSFMVPWAKLAELDEDPATVADKPPEPGLKMTVAVPIELEREFKAKPGTDYDLSVSLYWGTERGDIDVEQAEAKVSLEALYKTDWGLKAAEDPREQHEQLGGPPLDAPPGQ
jgi:hypothetical protein